MSLDVVAIQAALIDKAATLGRFDQIAGHEPKNKPGNGISLALWLDEVRAWGHGSGLASTSALVTWNARASVPMLREPLDRIDTDLGAAGAAYMEALAGGFTLGGTVRNVDLLGEASGIPLLGKAGYLNQDGSLFRVFTITIPMIVNDVFVEGS